MSTHIRSKTPRAHNQKRYFQSIFAGFIVFFLSMETARAETDSGVKAVKSQTVMEQSSIRPMWVVRDFKLTNQSQWTKREAQQWLFRSLELTSEIMRFNEQVCKLPRMVVKPISLEELVVWTGGLTGNDLKIPDGPLQLVKTGS